MAHDATRIRWVLGADEVSARGVTRFAWNDADIEDFIALIISAVEATGGKANVRTVSHSQALCEYTRSGAPDAEDHQMVMLAVNAGATVLATSDTGLLAMGEFQGVEMWHSDEIVAEVAANVRRLQAEAMSRMMK